MEPEVAVPAQNSPPDQRVQTNEIAGNGETTGTVNKKTGYQKIVAPRRRDGMMEITDRDVLSGRGGCTNTHPGNRLFRRIVRLNQAAYKDSSANAVTKNLLAISIIEAIRRKGGRFMQRDPKNKKWIELPPKEARNKTTQALRGEVYLKNPGSGDWFAKKRPAPGTRTGRGAKTPVSSYAPPTGIARGATGEYTLKDARKQRTSKPPVAQPQEHSSKSRGNESLLPNRLTGEVNLWPPHGHHGFRAPSAKDKLPSMNPKIDDEQTKKSGTKNVRKEQKKADPPNPPGKGSPARNDDSAIFLDALEGMTGVSFRKDQRSPPKTDTNSNGVIQNSDAGGLMSLAALAGIYADKEDDKSAKQPKQEAPRHATRYPDPAPSLTSERMHVEPTKNNIDENKHAIASHHSLPGGIAHPLIASPALVPPTMVAPTVPVSGHHPNQAAAAAAAAFRCSYVQYNRLGGGCGPQQPLFGLEHHNWNVANGLPVTQNRLLLNPLLWQSSLHPMGRPNVMPEHVNQSPHVSVPPPHYDLETARLKLQATGDKPAALTGKLNTAIESNARAEVVSTSEPDESMSTSTSSRHGNDSDDGKEIQNGNHWQPVSAPETSSKASMSKKFSRGPPKKRKAAPASVYDSSETKASIKKKKIQSSDGEKTHQGFLDHRNANTLDEGKKATQGIIERSRMDLGGRNPSEDALSLLEFARHPTNGVSAVSASLKHQVESVDAKKPPAQRSNLNLSDGDKNTKADKRKTKK